MHQSDVFFESEGDRWFERNQGILEKSLERDLVLRLMDTYGLKPPSVLEVGAANGFRLAEIVSRLGASAVAVEVAERAIEDGKKRYPFIRFVRAPAHAIPLDELFDCVIVHFVFHWIDRSCLLRAVAEIDRLLRDGGHLLIGDFHPRRPVKVPYHHLPGETLFTYKQDYAAIFASSGLYQRVGMLSAHHASGIASHVGEQDRVAVTLLEKKLESSYLEQAR